MFQPLYLCKLGVGEKAVISAAVRFPLGPPKSTVSQGPLSDVPCLEKGPTRLKRDELSSVGCCGVLRGKRRPDRKDVPVTRMGIKRDGHCSRVRGFRMGWKGMARDLMTSHGMEPGGHDSPPGFGAYCRPLFFHGSFLNCVDRYGIVLRCGASVFVGLWVCVCYASHMQPLWDPAQVQMLISHTSCLYSCKCARVCVCLCTAWCGRGFVLS